MSAASFSLSCFYIYSRRKLDRQSLIFLFLRLLGLNSSEKYFPWPQHFTKCLMVMILKGEGVGVSTQATSGQSRHLKSPFRLSCFFTQATSCIAALFYDQGRHSLLLLSAQSSWSLADKETSWQLVGRYLVEWEP